MSQCFVRELKIDKFLVIGSYPNKTLLSRSRDSERDEVFLTEDKNKCFLIIDYSITLKNF